jgi:hypothetical protein
MKYLKLFEELNENLEEKIEKIANKIFKLNYNNYLKNSYEFSVVIYLDKFGKLKTSEPVIGEESEVSLAEVDGTPVGVVHSHNQDDIAELSSWDEELGYEMCKKTGGIFVIYVIGFNEDGDIIMTSQIFEDEIEK